MSSAHQTSPVDVAGQRPLRRGPLAGRRVLDLGRFVAGPVAATILGEFGAHVIKVERPKVGDDLRRLGWSKDGHSLWWSVEGRNKDSVTLDLSSEQGAELFLRLVEHADVVVENFRPGTLERWGIGWETMRERNDKLILLRTSGYGQIGPYADRAAFNTAVESLGGLRYIMGEPDRPPARPGIALGDYAGALTGVIGVLLALYDRDVDGGQPSAGTGQWIDNALFEAVMRITEYTVPAYQHLGRVRERIGSESVGTVPARSFQCADGTWVGISAANDAMFGRLCTAMDRPDLIEDPRVKTNADRIKNSGWIHDIIAEWIARCQPEEVLAELTAAGVSASEVMSSARLVRDPHVLARESVIDVKDPLLGNTLMQNVVPRLSANPGGIDHAGPALGSSNSQVYQGLLGLSDEEFESYASAGII
jgi:crotonobetainyl-CoA:carnitine CoA-transferase CaiB-like acyl-CoA transferase